MGGSIADFVRKCLGEFDIIRKTNFSSAGASDRKHALGIGEEEARFKIWSGNLAAHSTGRRSLQYRLRDASHLQKQVTSLLDELLELLRDASLIMSGAKVPWDRVEDDDTIPLDADSDSDSDSEFDGMPDTEMAQIVQNVSDVVNCLLRLSVAIRNPAPHDRFTTSVSVEASHYEPFDIRHVKAKFGEIEPFLADRLGKAISRRRQYFKYRESHHLKLKQGLDSVEQNDVESTVASSLPLHAKAAGFSLKAMDEDEGSDSGLTQTSLASSNADSEKLRVPPLPREAEDGPFECPFCYMIIVATSTASWKRHVLADLRPYVCLWEDCTASGMEFMRRHEWTLHEIQNHRKTYKYLSARTTKEDERVSCPLCKQALPSMKDYQRHVGRHQEQLALFALPSLQIDDDEYVEDHASGTHSHVSSEDLDAALGGTEEGNPLESSAPTKSIGDAMKALDDLSNEYHTKWLPLCSDYIKSPPSNPKKRVEDHKKLCDDVRIISYSIVEVAANDGVDEELRKSASELRVIPGEDMRADEEEMEPREEVSSEDEPVRYKKEKPKDDLKRT
ncbi:transcription factor [Fusarium sporotrichioides]|uniref:Transcription factor n=1 Tax=Fusarium sporotrichioides TaxID=5514 RepID=A0A395SBK9_FUSSP|nr:transcription factor [Fusarium sporotrichioides]